MTIQFNVPDMSCGHCKSAIETALRALDPLVEIEFDMQSRTIAVDSDASAENISAALQQAGFPTNASD